MTWYTNWEQNKVERPKQIFRRQKRITKRFDTKRQTKHPENRTSQRSQCVCNKPSTNIGNRKQAETPNNRHWSKDFRPIHRRNKDSATKKNEPREEERNKLQQTEKAGPKPQRTREQNWKEEEHFLNSPIKLQTPTQKYGLKGL
jgi:hypothetical protein